MRLKVICQVCREIGVTETTEANQDWEPRKVTDLLHDIDEALDWEVWFHSWCLPSTETTTYDDYFDFFEKLFRPQPSERT